MLPGPECQDTLVSIEGVERVGWVVVIALGLLIVSPFLVLVASYLLTAR